MFVLSLVYLLGERCSRSIFPQDGSVVQAHRKYSDNVVLAWKKKKVKSSCEYLLNLPLKKKKKTRGVRHFYDKFILEKRKQNMKEKNHLMSRQNIGEQELSDVIMREEMRSLRLSRRKTRVRTARTEVRCQKKKCILDSS